MATRKTTKKETEFKKIDCGEGFILHYRQNDYGLFNLEHNGAIIYSCHLAERKDDKNLFISYPARKGNDGKYYCHARFLSPIPDSVIEKIADAVEF